MEHSLACGLGPSVNLQGLWCEFALSRCSEPSVWHDSQSSSALSRVFFSPAWAPKSDFYVYLFLFFEFGTPPKKNSGKNPMSSQFLTRGTWGPQKVRTPREEILHTPLPTSRDVCLCITNRNCIGICFLAVSRFLIMPSIKVSIYVNGNSGLQCVFI